MIACVFFAFNVLLRVSTASSLLRLLEECIQCSGFLLGREISRTEKLSSDLLGQ